MQLSKSKSKDSVITDEMSNEEDVKNQKKDVNKGSSSPSSSDLSSTSTETFEVIIETN